MNRIAIFIKEFGWLGTAVAAVATGAWAVTTYLQNAKLEYIKDFNTKQMEAILKTTAAVSGLVAESDAAEWRKHQAAFWKLHYGDLVLFESPEIECAMTYFGAKLNATDFERRSELGPKAFAVSAALRKFIVDLNNNEWRIKLSSLVGVKGEVAPMLGLKATPPNLADVEKKIDEKCKKIS